MHWPRALFLMFIAGASVNAQEDTNIVAAAVTDEEAGWESVFTKEN